MNNLCGVCGQPNKDDVIRCGNALCNEDLARPLYSRPPGSHDARRTMLLRDSIIVWRWDDAPAFLKALSSNGGDEDWLVLVPKRLAKGYIGWLESPSFDSLGEPQVIPLKEGLWVRAGEDDVTGATVYIGAHA